MLSDKTKCNFFFTLLVIYYLQGFLYPQGSIISQISIVIISIIGLYYALKINTKPLKTPFIKGMNIFLIMIFVYGICYIFTGPKNYYVHGFPTHTDPYAFIKTSLISFLPIYTFYYFSQKGIINIKWLQVATYIIIALTITMYFTLMRSMLNLLENPNIEITNNTGYKFLMIIPLILIFNNKRLIQFLLLGIVFFFIISSMKRGAIIIASICLLYFIVKVYKSCSIKERIYLLILIFIFLIGALFFINYMLESSSYFSYRLNSTLEGDSSGRDIIYKKIWDYFLEDTNIITFLFGSGADYSIVVAGNFAHNDWLELAIDCGILGIIVYYYYFYCLYKSIKAINRYSLKNVILKICFLILILRSFFSMSYSSIYFPLSLAIAYCISDMKRDHCYN